MDDRTVFHDKTATYYTLGCKLNFAETSAISRQLLNAGVTRARKGEPADICVINTCTVTELADKKGRQMIRRAIHENPNAFVVVTGCYAQLRPDEVTAIEGVDLVLGTEQKFDLLKYMGNLTKKGKAKAVVSEAKRIRTFAPSISADDRTRYFLKVQDGCDYFCSYCTIPFARGRSRNASIGQLVRQAEQVVEEGGKEIVLTGVNIGDFGRTTGETFIDLIRDLDRVDGVERYRISSIEPNLLSNEIIDFVAASRRFAPHFHIPLQSGSDAVLLQMGRRYDTTLFRQKIERIKAVLPHAFIGVDVIVGVRGETDAYFEEGRAFIESLDFLNSMFSPTPSVPVRGHCRLITWFLPGLSRLEARCCSICQSGNCTRFTSHKWEVKGASCSSIRRGHKMHGFTENYVRLHAILTRH